CNPCFLLLSRIIVIILTALQGGVINYYLIYYQTHNWYSWIAGDVAIFFSFFMAFFISYRELKIVHDIRTTNRGQSFRSTVEAGSFPLVYFAWLVYSVILAVRVGIIYKDLAYEIKPGILLGTNMLRLTIAMSGVIFLLVVAAHHDTRPGTMARNQINLLSTMVPFDIIDAVDILSVFFLKENRDALDPVLQWFVIIMGCINLVLPAVPLMMLSGSRFGSKPLTPYLHSLNKLIHIFVINIPLFTVRLLMWLKEDQEVSPLIMKNIVLIIMLSFDLYE
ncbi:unnamed protein product, partial [Lymnaea stagnalis]